MINSLPNRLCAKSPLGCGKPLTTPFRSQFNRDEFEATGLCQSCQDGLFGSAHVLEGGDDYAGLTRDAALDAYDQLNNEDVVSEGSRKVRVLEMVLREAPCDYRLDQAQLNRPHNVAALACKLGIDNAAEEQVWAFFVDSSNSLLSVAMVSKGSLGQSLVHPREVFKAAIAANAAGLVLVHNHPSGNPTPSGDDVTVTTRIVRAGKLLGIPLLDHVVIGTQGSFESIRLIHAFEAMEQGA